MSLFWIKIIALLTMTLDHLGVFLFPNSLNFRLIGRLSFPLFAWAIANGAHNTKNLNKYILRLFIFALISQVPFQLLINTIGLQKFLPNILFTFFTSLLGIWVIKNIKNIILKTIAIFTLSVISIVAKVDYQFFGVVSVWIFYYFFNKRVKLIIYYFLFVLIYSYLPLFIRDFYHYQINIRYLDIIQPISTLALILTLFYNEKIGPKFKYLFYIFYPLHLLLIYLIKKYLT